MSDAASWKRVRALVERCLELPLSERRAYLDSECGDDLPLRAEVESLLSVPEDPALRTGGAAGLLAGVPPGGALRGLAADETIGTTIGKYKLLERIGDGGFGVVFLAEQVRPVARRVALKILKLGMDTKEIVARFKQEQQALARLEHPAICKVYDAGVTPSGRPFFAMEYLPSIDLVSYCDSNRLGLRARIEIFLPICDAVGHAHQRAIVHRDIKPSNILVTHAGDHAAAKLIDFGIAKALGGRIVDATLHTEQRSYLGTPVYMSPEQASSGGRDVDTRADIYSLGVVLYQLLAGVTPHDPATLRSPANVAEVLRAFDPRSPSARIADGGPEATVAARNRGMEAHALTRALRGELDWITMRAIEKSVARRCPTVDEFAGDLRRYLAGEPVRAAPPSVRYRVEKFVARNRTLVLTGSALGVAMLAVVGMGAYVAVVVAQKNLGLVEANRKANLAEYAGFISAVSSALTAQQYPRARAMLERCSMELRGWEWRVLGSRAVAFERVGGRSAPDGTTLSWTSDMSSDGTRVVAKAAFGLVVLEALSGRVVSSIRCGNDLAEFWLLWDGRTVITRARNSSQLEGWDAATGEKIYSESVTTISNESWEILAFREAGSEVLTLTPPGVLKLWDGRDGKLIDGFEIASANANGEEVVDADILPDNRVVWVMQDGSVYVASVVDNSKRKVELPPPLGGRVLRAHPTRSLAAMSEADRVVILDADHASSLKDLDCGGRWVESMSFSRNGSALLAQFKDGSCRVWETESWRSIMDVPRSGEERTSVALSWDGSRVLEIEDAGAARVWDIRTRRVMTTTPDFLTDDPGASGFFVGKDGSAIAIGDGGVFATSRVGEALGFELFRTLGFPEAEPKLELGKSLVHARLRSGETAVYSLKTGARFEVSARATEAGVGLEIDDAHVVVPISENEVEVFDVQTGKLLRRLDIGGQGRGTRRLRLLSPGRLLATNSEYREGEIWDLVQGRKVTAFDPSFDVEPLVVSDGSSICALAIRDGVHTWDIENGRPGPVVAHPGAASSTVSLSEDGTLLAIAGESGSRVARVFDGALVWSGEGIVPGYCASDTIRWFGGSASFGIAVDRASGSADARIATMRLYGASSGAELGTWRTWRSGYDCPQCGEGLALKRIVIKSPDGTVLVNALDGKEIRRWSVSSDSACTMVWSVSVDESLALVQQGPCGASLIELDTGATQATLQPEWSNASRSAFSPDSTLIAGVIGDSVRFARTVDGVDVRSIEPDIWGRNLDTVEFTSDGSRLWLGDANQGFWELWNISTGVRVWSSRGLPEGTRCLKVAPKAMRAVVERSIGSDRVVGELLDMDSGAVLQQLWLRTESDRPLVAISAGGVAVATGRTGHGDVLIGARRQFGNAERVTPHPDGVMAMAGSASAEVFACCGVRGDVSVRYGEFGHFRTLPGDHFDRVRTIALSPDGTWLVLGLDDGTIVTVDVAFGSPGWGAVRLRTKVLDVAIERLEVASGAGTIAAWASGQVALVDSADGRIIERAQSSLPTGELDRMFSADGRFFLAMHEQKVSVLNAATGETAGFVVGPQVARCAAISDDGRSLAVGGAEGGLFLYSLESGPLLAWAGHSGPVRSVAFHPDGSRVASTAADDTLALWMSGSHLPVLTEEDRPGARSVRFSESGDRLLIVDDRGLSSLVALPADRITATLEAMGVRRPESTPAP